MPVIQFTEADKLAGKTLEKGVYVAEITEIDGPKASQSQKSINFFVKFRITKGPVTNKELMVAFGSGISNGSVLGGLQFLPHRDLLKVKAAIDDVKFDDINTNLDTDELLHKPLDIAVGIETSDGNLVNTITAFLPAGKGEAATSAPF